MPVLRPRVRAPHRVVFAALPLAVAALPLALALALGASLALALGAVPALAQAPAGDVAKLAASPTVRAALANAESTHERAVQDEIELCEIPAPPFHETVRGREYARRLAAAGMDSVWTDTAGNVIGLRKGASEDPTVVIAGHLDTVFPEGTDVSVTRTGTVLKGPGIGDDCRGLAVVLATARALKDAGIRTRGNVYFVGDVGEEGLGDLRGMKNLFGESLEGRIDYFISVDGAGLSLTKDGVGSHRYKVTFKGPGGHSYGAFGLPSPIHAMGRAIAKISDFTVPKTPKTTFNVGEVEGGTSVNSIAYEASMLVDMRSVSAASLDELDGRFHAAIQQALDEENARMPDRKVLSVDIESVGVRPAGSQPASAPIVQTGLAAAKALGFEPRVGASSTDANVPISLGIPGVTIDGGGQGHGAHSLDETFDTKDAWKGVQWAILYVLGLAGTK